MLIKNMNRWAVVDYLRAYGEGKKDELFVKIADAIDTDVRPTGLSDSEEMLVDSLIRDCSKYKMHQSLCLEVVEALRKIKWPEDIIIKFVTCLMLDSTERDREWERRHYEFEHRSNSGFRVDYMSMNPREADYMKPHQIL